MHLLVSTDTSPTNLRKSAAELLALADKLEGKEATASASPAAAPEAVEDKPKRGRPPKSRKEEVAESDDDFDLGMGEESDGDDNQEEPTHTLEDVIEGFRAYATKNGKDKAVGVLKKLGYKSVREIPADKYSEVMAKVA